MGCNIYDRFLKGEVEKDQLDLHLKSCDQCKELKEIDDRLLDNFSDLNADISTPTPELWSSIESELTNDRKSEEPSKIIKVIKYSLSSAAAIIILITLTTTQYREDKGSDRILSYSAIAEVERMEEQYISSISTLEKISSDSLNTLDSEIIFLYKDKLSTINRQIARCQSALEDNPGSNHIRGYLLSALQDKKNTLVEIIDYSTNTQIDKIVR